MCPVPRQQHGYRRAISAGEWLYAGMAPRNSNMVQYVVEGAGTLEERHLAEAVARASQASPGTRLVRDGRYLVDSGVAPRVRVMEAGSFDQRALDAPALQEMLRSPGATFEVLLFPGAAEGPGAPGVSATVVFRAWHGVTDARGLMLWIEDIFRVLRGSEPLGAPSTLSREEFLEQLEWPGGLPPIPQRVGELVWSSPLGPLPRRPPGRTLWRRRTVDGSHPAATAKAATAVAEVYGPEGGGRFFVPVDLRRHTPQLRSTGWLSQAFVLDVTAGDSWQEVHARALKSLADGAELAVRTDPRTLKTPLALIRLFSSAVDRTAVRKNQYSALSFITHLGVHDLASFSTDGFTATALYALGGTGPGAPPSIDMVESGNRTEVTVTWQDGPGVAERAQALLDVVEEALSPRRNRVWAGNDTARELTSDASVVRRFREQVRRAPDRIALSGPEGPVTYGELSRQADAVATALRERGAGPGTVVGLLADRSVALLAGLWGVLRAGACYLPMDVQHPDTRLSGLLADAGAAFCLVQEPYGQRAVVPEGCEQVELDRLTESRGPEQGGEPPFEDAEVSPDDLAYVIYTSGSTGRPKGVQIEHRSLAHYVEWATREFGVDADTRLPLITSPSFDVTGTSVFLPLLAGGEVVLMPLEPSHLSLRQLLQISGATMLNLTPSHLDLIGQLDIAPSGFRSVVVVGEQLRVEVAARAQQMFGPRCRIINLYGPTEATIGCTAHTFRAGEDTGIAVPIGVPADNTSVHLLDEGRRFVARGDVGEMYLGGVQLARGYLGRPDLDRERFVRLADGSRVYRTGDLARVMPSGGLEFVGRIDDQVKVRGHRVEPAEVAKTLEDHPGVTRAVVVARARTGSSSKALYAYVVTDSDVSEQQALTTELTAYVAERLPRYMVPAAIVALPGLPYTVSGKVDTKALPDVFADDPDAGQDAPAAQEGPRDPVEDAVAQVWARTLGVDRSRLDGASDFHRLGGDSLSLLTMIAGVCRTVLDTEGEAAFMAELAQIAGEPTLDRVVTLCRKVAGTWNVVPSAE
ncbi:non-ribosomal peptide synthetase [Streptomyces sp. SL13]|uniref:Non-ribosomal peptide synthetase n=1 Tax=Streptantibioticus silvisoli TaxID=2705255 RepID=A0AA90HE68_9ACTN|nr:non-ribosomal peptide synthetase [Streptantibioticus silvisoli]MDI5973252.1 non-ribosomal peptide synthetase [Streptantibioticus silvisoli]